MFCEFFWVSVLDLTIYIFDYIYFYWITFLKKIMLLFFLNCIHFSWHAQVLVSFWMFNRTGKRSNLGTYQENMDSNGSIQTQCTTFVKIYICVLFWRLNADSTFVAHVNVVHDTHVSLLSSLRSRSSPSSLSTEQAKTFSGRFKFLSRTWAVPRTGFIMWRNKPSLLGESVACFIFLMALCDAHRCKWNFIWLYVG